jgi:hypothetical protein
MVCLLGGCAFVPGEPGTDDATLKAASRSIWGVVPEAPRRKADLRPELIRGSAVAVGADTLLASCRVVGERSRVGLVRHNKYRIARVAAADGDVCALRVDQGPLVPAQAYRRVGNLQPGEPVFAFTSRTPADLALSRGDLAGTGSAADPFLETTLALPPGAESAVLFDADGNLIGLGSAGPTRDSLVLAAPVTGGLAPALASREREPARLLLAHWWPPLDSGDREPPLLFRTSPGDEDDGADPATRSAQASLDDTPVATPADSAAADAAPDPAPAAAHQGRRDDKNKDKAGADRDGRDREDGRGRGRGDDDDDDRDGDRGRDGGGKGRGRD